MGYDYNRMSDLGKQGFMKGRAKRAIKKPTYTEVYVKVEKAVRGRAGVIEAAIIAKELRLPVADVARALHELFFIKPAHEKAIEHLEAIDEDGWK